MIAVLGGAVFVLHSLCNGMRAGSVTGLWGGEWGLDLDGFGSDERILVYDTRLYLCFLHILSVTMLNLVCHHAL